ncbi:MAG TPA: hydroxymethylbilane synthase [Thermoanaerobaculia bacterium]|nr:hydroxymethylbilane synthase [Thermoanaerobaculia bacterium]
MSLGQEIHLRLGTRRSPLALAQSSQVARALEAARPGLVVELVPIETTGDRTAGDLAKFGGKGLFTAELEQGLLDNTLDFAVHSLKDLPVALPEGLAIAAYPERADGRDALISELSHDLAGLPEGAELLTGSLRRRAQILALRPDLRVEPIRGNVDTRIRKWRERGAAGVILAASGLQRLTIDRPELAELPIHLLSTTEMVPAPGQGILALEVRAGSPAHEICTLLDHAQSRREAQAERAVVAAFGGDCTLPLAVFAQGSGSAAGLHFSLFLGTPDGGKTLRHDATGDDPHALAAACVAALRAAGADEILTAIRKDEDA